jgi:hypothetical protein
MCVKLSIARVRHQNFALRYRQCVMRSRSGDRRIERAAEENLIYFE